MGKRMAEQRDPIIELKGIYRHFMTGSESVAVLKDISLRIAPGEMVAIVGASGSGKSTLMNIIGCLDQPTRGEMFILGTPTHSADENQLAQLRSQHLGFIFQRYHLMPYLTAAENVEIPALYTAMPPQERQQRTRYLLKRLGLGSRMNYKPSQLSGGQQQRVSISRALVNGASIILADEPTGALDSSSGQELMSVLHGLHQAGHTIIIVTHDHNVARQAERIIEISDGRIIDDRPNDAIKHDGVQESLNRVENNGRAPLWASIMEAVRMAWRSLLGHRVRAFLSMLGIIIGISSVVSSIAVGEGARQKVLDEIGKLGNSTMDIRPGLGWGEQRRDMERALSIEDVELIRAQPYVDSVTPVINKSVPGVRNGKTSFIQLSGVTNDYFRVQELDFIAGNQFTHRDVEDREPVLIIDESARNLFFSEDEDPIDQILSVSGTPWRIIGIANLRGINRGGRLSGWLPYTSLVERISGEQPIEIVTVRVQEGASLEQARHEIESLLIQAHGKRDFFIESNDELAKAMDETSKSLSLLITAIAAISLFVGGVGVMNIMLVSVTERTHEIGIRLSVGARPIDIMRQFLIESMVICTLGGLIGIVGAWSAGKVFAVLTDEFTMIFTWPPLLLACVFSAVIGLGFGFFPARNAARLHPTEALARE